MAKIFTITEGLENMGALRTGGQGSIYKGKRIGEIIVAVKLLPTPILDESDNDKNFRDFRNEVEKLKKVNEEPNPNVVKILNSGITESGSFPFIEMEFIEGPDLEELLKEPHDPIFSISEIIKVAGQLANALSHCHKVFVKHGDIKSNNVKFNINTGNYMLLDFGLAIMSDEQRRTSLRHAGAVEFMAPEQNEGSMLFESDVYSYGIVLYELLAGVVPFPLKDNGQTARNTVMVAHTETPVPDALELRRQHLPDSWSQEKKDREMQVPAWLLALISKCLQKDPDHRFGNGMEVQEAILLQNSNVADQNDVAASPELQSENQRLQALVMQDQQKVAEKDRQIAALTERLKNKEQELQAVTRNGALRQTENAGAVSISRPILYTLLLLIAGLSAFAGYQVLGNKQADTANMSAVMGDSVSQSDGTEDSVSTPVNSKSTRQRKAEQDSADLARAEMEKLQEVIPAEPDPSQEEVIQDSESNSSTDNDIGKVFSLAVPEAYFHDKPDPDTRRKAFINHWNKARLTALNDLNGFIYVVYTNEDGQTSKGWMNKKDLVIIGE